MEGGARDAICQLADDENFDLIIVGNRGRGMVSNVGEFAQFGHETLTMWPIEQLKERNCDVSENIGPLGRF